MRAILSALAAICVLVFCGVGLVVMLAYILTGNHGASFADDGWLLLLLAWGGASAVGVLRQRALGHRSLLAWGILTSLALCAAGVVGAFPWPGALSLIGGLLVACLLVSGPPRATR